jgi:hypothetical protein
MSLTKAPRNFGRKSWFTRWSSAWLPSGGTRLLATPAPIGNWDISQDAFDMEAATRERWTAALLTGDSLAHKSVPLGIRAQASEKGSRELSVCNWAPRPSAWYAPAVRGLCEAGGGHERR